MTANPIERLDVPVTRVELQLASEVCRKAMAATHSPSDRIAYANDLFLLAHPKACSKNEDYPGFADWVARQQKKNEAARRTHTKVRTGGRARINARAAADAEATHWRRLGMTPPADPAVRPTDDGSAR